MLRNIIISLPQSFTLQISCVFSAKKITLLRSLNLCDAYIVKSHLSQLAGFSNVSLTPASPRKSLFRSSSFHHTVKIVSALYRSWVL